MHSEFTVVEPFWQVGRTLDDVLDTFSLEVEAWEGEGIPEWICDVNGEFLYTEANHSLF
jgi:hypothetical protein